MMRKLIVLGIVVLMVAGLTGMAHAYDISLYVTYGTSSQTIEVGDDNSSDANVGNPGGESPYVTGAAFETSDVTKSTPLLEAYDESHAATTAWNIELWGGGAYAGATAKVYVQLNDNGDPTSPNYPYGEVGGSYVALGTQWTMSGVGTAAVPDIYDFTSPTDSTTVLLGTAVVGTAAAPTNFTFNAVAVPEPGSVVALFTGLVGLVGFGIRRRK